MKRLSKKIFQLFHNSGMTLATAESCTAGAIAKAIVETAGASAYFKGGIVSYTNEVKEKLLGVNHEVLETQTAVCEEVAREMVIGACASLNADYAVAATGLAGPGGGTEAIPVGTIFIACGRKDRVVVRRLQQDLGRAQNLKHATAEALQLIIDFFDEEKCK